MPATLLALIMSGLIGIAGLQGSWRWLRYSFTMSRIHDQDGAGEVPLHEALIRVAAGIALIVLAGFIIVTSLANALPDWVYVAAILVGGLTTLVFSVAVLLALLRRIKVRSQP